jgi:natural product precursor
MKKLRKLNLNDLNKTEMQHRELYSHKGGSCFGYPGSCGCPCAYEGTPGGSSTWDNLQANDLYGYNPSYGN